MWFCVSRDNAFVVSENDSVCVLGNYVLWHYRSLTATARSVNYKCRNCITGGVTTETFDDLDTL